MIRYAIEAIKGWTLTDIAYHSADEASELLCKRIDEIVGRLLLDEPLQYILGEARFHGFTLKVNPSVLIPRPETSQLVDIIVDRAGDRPDLHVLDIGTGSGAIAIALARALRFPVVEAIDISSAAIDTARLNAATLNAEITFRQADILEISLPADSYDIIVSNPPYIAYSEKPSIAPNVLLHEPENALFVPDSDPLLFYRRISQLATAALKPGGMLYFEINQRFGKETADVIKRAGLIDVEIIRDYKGNPRFAIAQKA